MSGVQTKIEIDWTSYSAASADRKAGVFSVFVHPLSCAVGAPIAVGFTFAVTCGLLGR